ncbi:EthD domain-containing protein [Spirosoma flavum]|uniref:EthD domain-containing protein n=1 Tax=Spirosoma flavum TaxID=2048557 RepID=A0ABW6AQM7_9BACT
MVKFTILLRKRENLSHDEFVTYHKTKHAPLFNFLPEVQKYVRKYVQCHSLSVTLPGMPPPAYDGITELWFDDITDIGKVFTAERYMALIRPDEGKFLDLSGCGFLVSTETQQL